MTTSEFPEEFGDIWGAKRHFHERPSDPIFEVIFEDEDLLIINKPAGLVCHPTRHGPYSSIIGRVRTYLGEGSESPHLVNRLDRETSGLVVVAKSVPAAMAARELWLNGSVKKSYLAVVRETVNFRRLLIDAPMGKHPSSLVGIRDAVVETGGKPARTLVTPLQVDQFGPEPSSLLEIAISSGRKHQIRIHLEWAGCPLLGDKIYGGDERCYADFIEKGLNKSQKAFLRIPNQALHAWRLSFVWKGVKHRFQASPDLAPPWDRFRNPAIWQKTF